MLASGSALANDRPNLPSHLPTPRATEVLVNYAATGETRGCVSMRHIQTITALDPHHFLFEMRGGSILVNQTGRGCTRAGAAYTRIDYGRNGTTLCQTDLLNVVDRSDGEVWGGCPLGVFHVLEPYERSGAQISPDAR